MNTTEFLDRITPRIQNVVVFSIPSSNIKHDEYISGLCIHHGDFSVRVGTYLRGKYIGCPTCSRKLAVENKKVSVDEWIEKVNKIHHNKYQYSQVYTTYTSQASVVPIICKVHGTFFQRASEHIRYGCKSCAIDSQRRPKDSILQECACVHNNKFVYSDVVYNSVNDKVKIICPSHGSFEQILNDHRRGKNGCVQCVNAQRIETSTHKYGVSNWNQQHITNLEQYVNNDMFREVLVEKGPVLTQEHFNIKSWALNNRTRQVGIDPSLSYLESSVVDFLRSVDIVNVVLNSRSIISPYEVDIFLPDYNVAIELHGLYWHCDKHVDDKYHQNKFHLAHKANIRLIQIFEHEWIHKSSIIKQKLLSILNKLPYSIPARKCSVIDVPFNQYASFCEQYHIQGPKFGVTLKKGLIFDNQLVSVISMKHQKLERFCSSSRIVGGLSKLLSVIPGSIETFADLRFSNPTQNAYVQTGFVFSHYTSPNYVYWKSGQLDVISRISAQKYKILNKNPHLDSTKTERELMLELGYRRIYDAGHAKFQLNRI